MDFFVFQEKSLEKMNSYPFCSYNIILSLLEYFRLVIEHGKSEVFYFSRLHRVYNLPPLDLSYFGGPILKSKNTWRYPSFIFDRKLSFWQHIKFYSNKVLSTVKYMKMLGNSTQGLSPQQKQLFYRACVLPIILYSFSLWHFNKILLHFSLRKL